MERCIFAHAISDIDRPLVRDILCLYLIRQVVCNLNPYLAVGQQCFHQLVHRLWLCLFRLLGTDLADVIGFLDGVPLLDDTVLFIFLSDNEVVSLASGLDYLTFFLPFFKGLDLPDLRILCIKQEQVVCPLRLALSHKIKEALACTSVR